MDDDGPWNDYTASSSGEEEPWKDYAPHQVGALESLSKGAVSGAMAGWTDQATAAANPKVSGLPMSMSPLVRAPVGAARLAYERFIKPQGSGERGPATEAYNKALTDLTAETKEMKSQHPYWYGAGELSGAGASMAAVPMGEVAGLGARALQGAKIGAGYGAVTGAASGSEEGGLPGAGVGAITGGLTGAALGAGSEVALNAAAPLVRPITNKIGSAYRAFKDPEAEASRQLLQSSIGDKRNAGRTWEPPTQEQTDVARQAGLPLAAVDVLGPESRALGEWSATTSPEAKARFERLNQRLPQAPQRVAQFIQDMTGGGDLAADQAAIKAAASPVNKAAYRQAMDDAKGMALWDDELKDLVQAPEVQSAIRIATPQLKNWAVKDGMAPPVGAFEIKNGVTDLKQTVGGNQYMPSLQYWDYVKRALDKMNTPTAKAFSQTLRSKLDDMVPSYQTARAGAAQFFGAQDALEAGSKFVNPQTNFKMGDARQALAKMSIDERDLFARGFATQLAERVSSGGQRALNSTFNNEQVRERVEMALGPQRARQLEALLRMEQVAASSGNLYLGSPTARRLALQSALGVGFAGGEAGYEYLTHGALNPMQVMTAGTIPFALGHGQKILNERLAAQLGRMLTSDDPAIYAKGIQLAARVPAAMDRLRNITAGGATTVVPKFVPQAAVAKKDEGPSKDSAALGQHKDGGAAQRKANVSQRKVGGSVHSDHKPPLKRKFLPQSIGASRAKDGQWYIRDKSRPGKWLQVIHG
jgi:hypothetical protein